MIWTEMGGEGRRAFGAGDVHCCGHPVESPEATPPVWIYNCACDHPPSSTGAWRTSPNVARMACPYSTSCSRCASGGVVRVL